MKFYFKPHKLEEVRGKSIYRFVGVRFFKRYLLLTDLVMFRVRKKQQMNTSRGQLGDELNRLEWQTRRDESIHILFMFAVFLILSRSDHSVTTLIFLMTINTYANVYPIFVQRYNRLRILRVMRGAGYSTPYD